MEEKTKGEGRMERKLPIRLPMKSVARALFAQDLGSTQEFSWLLSLLDIAFAVPLSEPELVACHGDVLQQLTGCRPTNSVYYVCY